VANFVADGALTYRFGAKLDSGSEVSFRSVSKPQYTIKEWVLPPGQHTIVVCAQGKHSFDQRMSVCLGCLPPCWAPRARVNTVPYC